MYNLDIKKLRTERKLTLKDIAESLFVTCGTVSRWEAGVHKPSGIYLKKLAEIFNVEIVNLPNELGRTYYDIKQPVANEKLTNLYNKMNVTDEQNYFLRSIIDTIDDYIYVKGRDHKIKFHNKILSKLLNSNSSLVGYKFSDFIKDDSFKSIMEIEQLAFKGTTIIKKEITLPDGKLGLMTAEPFYKDNNSIFCKISDISLEKQSGTEKKILLYIESFYKEILDDITASIFYVAVLGDNAHHIYLNSGVETLLCYKKELFYNDFTLFYELIHPKDRQRMRHEIIDSNYNVMTKYRIKNSKGIYMTFLTHNWTKKIDNMEFAYGYSTHIDTSLKEQFHK